MLPEENKSFWHVRVLEMGFFGGEAGGVFLVLLVWFRNVLFLDLVGGYYTGVFTF